MAEREVEAEARGRRGAIEAIYSRMRSLAGVSGLPEIDE